MLSYRWIGPDPDIYERSDGQTVFAHDELNALSSKLDQAQIALEAIRRMFNIHPDAPYTDIVDMSRETFKAYAMEMARHGGRR